MSDRPNVPTTPSTPVPPHQPASPPPPLDPIASAFLCDMEGVGELILVRHGQQDYPTDPKAPMADYVDPPLSEIGRRQAAAAGESLRGEHLDAVYSSTLERARETGRAIADHHGLAVTEVEALREIEMFRDLPEGQSLRDAVDPLLLRGMRSRFAQERTWDVFPFTETSAEFRHRIRLAIEGILASHPGGRVVVACHGGVIATYLSTVLGLAEDMFFRANHASVHRVAALGDRRVIRTLNEIHHLAAVDPALVTW